MTKCGFQLEFVDDEDNSYNAHDFDNAELENCKVFTNREEALEIL